MNANKQLVIVDDVKLFRNQMQQKMPWLQDHLPMIMSLGYYMFINRVIPNMSTSECTELRSASANCLFTVIENDSDRYFIKFADKDDLDLDYIENDAVILNIIELISNKLKMNQFSSHMMKYADSFWSFVDPNDAHKIGSKVPCINMSNILGDKSKYFPKDLSRSMHRLLGNLGFYKTMAVDYLSPLSLGKNINIGCELYVKFCNSCEIEEYYMWICEKLGDLFIGMIELGLLTGFCHGDAHLCNILFDKSTEKFVLIDLGRSTMNFDRVAKLLGQSVVDNAINVECMKLDDEYINNEQELPGAAKFFNTYINPFSIHSDNNIPGSICRSLPVMNDIASVSLGVLEEFTKLDDRRAANLIPFINIIPGVSVTLFTNPKRVVDSCLNIMVNQSHPLHTLAPGLAWMTLFMLCFVTDDGIKKHPNVIKLPYKQLINHVHAPVFTAFQIMASSFNDKIVKFTDLLDKGGFINVINRIIGIKGLPDYLQCVDVKVVNGDNEEDEGMVPKTEADKFRDFATREIKELLKESKNDLIDMYIFDENDFFKEIEKLVHYKRFGNLTEAEKRDIAGEVYDLYKSGTYVPGSGGMKRRMVKKQKIKYPPIKVHKNRGHRNSSKRGGRMEEDIDLDGWQKVYEMKAIMDLPKRMHAQNITEIQPINSINVSEPISNTRSNAPLTVPIQVAGTNVKMSRSLRLLLNIPSNMPVEAAMAAAQLKIRKQELNKETLQLVLDELDIPYKKSMTKSQLEKLLLMEWTMI